MNAKLSSLKILGLVLCISSMLILAVVLLYNFYGKEALNNHIKEAERKNREMLKNTRDTVRPTEHEETLKRLETR